MEISANISEQIVHITVSGTINTLEADKLLSEINTLPSGVCDIHFDLGDVSYISSSGLRVLLRALHIVKERGGAMKVTKASEFVREIITTVGFDQLFTVE